MQVGQSTTSIDHATATVSIATAPTGAVAANIVNGNLTGSSTSVSPSATGAKSSSGRLVVGLSSLVGVIGMVVVLL